MNEPLHPRFCDLFNAKQFEIQMSDFLFFSQGEKGDQGDRGQDGGCKMCVGFKGSRGRRGRRGPAGRTGRPGDRGIPGNDGLNVSGLNANRALVRCEELARAL